MEEEVKQDTSETETQEKRNTEECEETAEASAENTETPEDGEASEEKDKKGFFSGRKKEKKEDAAKKLDAKAIVDTEKSAAPSRLYLVLAAVSLILMIGTAVITTVQYLNICQGQKIELPGLPNK